LTGIQYDLVIIFIGPPRMGLYLAVRLGWIMLEARMV